MTTRSWLRNLFASRTPRTIRKAPARRHLHLELLEDRLVLSGGPDPIGRMMFVNHLPSYEPQLEFERELQAVAAARHIEENAAERTTILTATVNDLLEGAGPARISYILGYKTKKLIQVTVVWGTPVDPQAQPEKIVAAANQLRQLFLDSGYQPETVVANARMADGTILVFQGQDTDKHTTVLRLANTPAPAKGSKAEAAGASVALSLSYILDSRSPDIFRLKKGQF